MRLGGVDELLEQAEEGPPVSGSEASEGSSECAEVENVVGCDCGVTLRGEGDAEPSLVRGVALADEETPPFKVLDQNRCRALGQQQVLGQPGQIGTLADVSQQLTFVLPQPVAVIVRPVERAPQLAVQRLEPSSI
jgi:hypothetical protein